MTKRIVAGLLGMLFVLGLAGCGSSAGSGGATTTLKIFSMAPQSGGSADLGQGIHNGAKMYFEEHAADLAKVGFKVDVKAMDDEGKAEVGTQLAQGIVDDKAILAGVGTLNSGVAIPVSEKLKDSHVAMVSPANTATTVTDRRLANMNRICGRDDVQGPAGAMYVKNKLGAKSVFIIQDKTPYGQGLAEQFRKKAKEIGLEEKGYEGVNVGDTDFNAVLTKVKATNPDAVYYGGLYGEAGPMVKQMRSQGINAKFVGADGLEDPAFIKLAGDASAGVSYTTVAANTSSTDKGKDFVKRYTKKFNKGPGAYAAYGYDSAGVIADAIMRWGKDHKGQAPTRQELETLIRNTHGYQGIVTKVDFDDKGDNKEAQIFIFQFKDTNYDNRAQVDQIKG